MCSPLIDPFTHSYLYIVSRFWKLSLTKTIRKNKSIVYHNNISNFTKKPND